MKLLSMTLKYTITTKGQLLYRRRFPTKLRAHPQLKGEFYSKSLGLRSSASEEETLRAWQIVHRDYEDFIKGLELANIDALTAVENLRIAEATLKVKGLEPGLLAPNPLLTAKQQEIVQHDAYIRVLESGLVTALQEETEENYGKELTPQQQIAESAWKLLTEPRTRSASVLTLSECWEPYRDYKGLDISSRSGKRELSRYNKFLSIAGDTVVSQESVHTAIDSYISSRTASVSGPSVQREVQGILAVLRYCVRLYRLPIVISAPPIKGAGKYKTRKTLTNTESQALLKYIESGKIRPEYECAYYLLFHGLITSEVARMKPESMHLDAEIPYVAIEGDTKTESRKRYVPIVLGLDRLRELIPEVQTESKALGSSMDRTESNLSHSLGKIIKQGTGSSKLTPYSLRHTLKASLLNSGIDSQVIALIGGWSGLTNAVMLGYGSDSYSSSATMKRLHAALQTTFDTTFG